MRLLHITDLHGCMIRYNKILDLAKSNNIDIVVNSGDITPKNGTIPQLITMQDEFINNEYLSLLESFEKEKIYYLDMLGNDDLKVHESTFKSIHNDFEYCHEITHKSPLKIKNYKFIGYNFVPDYPFRLKDWVRQDDRLTIVHNQLGTAVFSRKQAPQGFIVAGDWFQRLRQTRTIEDELNCCVEKHWKTIDDKTVFVCHSPPTGIRIDKIDFDKCVGSKSIMKFIEKWQPRISLHGHIHEAKEVSGTYFGTINNTICFNPGQKSKVMPYVIIDLDTLTHNYYEL